MKSSQSPKEFDQNNRDVTSITGYVIKKNSSRGAKHGPSERQSCVTKLKRCCKKLVKKSTEAIHRHLHDGTTTTSSDFRCHSLGGSSSIWDRVASLWNSTLWTLTLNQEGSQQPLHQRPDFAQAKRECKRLDDEHLAKTQEEYRTIPRNQQIRQRKRQHLKATRNMTTWLTLKQIGGSTNVRGETCRQLRQDRGPTCTQLRRCRQRGTKPIGRRAISAFFKPWWLVKIVWVRTSFGCLEKKPPANRRAVTARTELHSMITFHHAWLQWKKQYGSIWCMISPVLTADDAVMSRIVTSRWIRENQEISSSWCCSPTQTRRTGILFQTVIACARCYPGHAVVACLLISETRGDTAAQKSGLGHSNGSEFRGLCEWTIQRMSSTCVRLQ